ncbi:hypothetical protein HMPREF1554_00759 [Porphyromonas gingivalis F0569]|nr:hypothetical protein HMPREF1554_00759 [Porphyromonas gingivalis F0569]
MFFFILFRLSLFLFLFYLLIKTEKRPKSSFPFRSLSQKNTAIGYCRRHINLCF